MRRILFALVAAVLLAACGRGAAAPLPADQALGFNDADVRFLQDMLPHHQQAIDMAELVDGRTRRPELVKLAARITTSQGGEIRSMQAFLTRWNRPVTADGGMRPDQSQVSGMLAEGQLEWLQTLKDTRFDLAFLTMMRTHHGGAVEMAAAELRSGSSAEVKALARQMILAQQTEIRQMQRWQDAWA